jgi:hypothetical protein
LFPVRFWDAISCWSLKAKAFFIDGSIFPFYTGHNYIFSHLSYPLYLPLSQTWIYIWIGEADQTLVKIIFPVFYAGLIYTAYYLLSKKLKKLSAVILAFILSATPIIIDHGYIEYTNLLFGTALLIGVWFLYLFLQEESNLYLKIIKKKRVFYGFEVYGIALTASLFFCIAAQVRSEGMIFLALFIAVLLGTRIRYLFDKIISKTGLVFSFALPSVACIVFLVPWLYLKKKLGLSFISTEWQSLLPGLTGSGGQQEMAGGQAVNLYFDFMESFNNISAEIAYSFSDSTRAFLGSSYGILWISLLTLFALKIKKMFRQFNWVFAVFFYSGLIMVFLSLGLVGEFAWSVDRYLLHIFPLAYFWVLSGLKNQPV